jgi:hypothetical protein
MCGACGLIQTRPRHVLWASSIGWERSSGAFLEGAIMSRWKLGHRFIAALGRPRRFARVDVAPLAANAGEPTADWVAQYPAGQIARNLAE